MNDMLAETELFSALAGLGHHPPETREELLERMSDLEKVVELFGEVQKTNPESSLVQSTLEIFRGSAGSLMDEEACFSFWQTFMLDSSEPFSLSFSRMEIGRMMIRELDVDVDIVTKMATYGPESLDIHECLDTIKAVSSWKEE